MAKKTRSIDPTRGKRASLDESSQIATVSIVSGKMADLAAPVGSTPDFGAAERKLAEIMAQATKPFDVGIPTAYLEMAKQIAVQVADGLTVVGTPVVADHCDSLKQSLM